MDSQLNNVDRSIHKIELRPPVCLSLAKRDGEMEQKEFKKKRKRVERRSRKAKTMGKVEGVVAPFGGSVTVLTRPDEFWQEPPHGCSNSKSRAKGTRTRRGAGTHRGELNNRNNNVTCTRSIVFSSATPRHAATETATSRIFVRLRLCLDRRCTELALCGIVWQNIIKFFKQLGRS